jgi:FdhE protein
MAEQANPTEHAAKHKWQALAQTEWMPHDLLVLAQDVWQARQQAPLPLVQLEAQQLASAQSHAQGAPLLPRGQFPLHIPTADDLLQQLCALCSQQTPLLHNAVRDLHASMEQGAVSTALLVHALLNNDDTPFVGWADAHPDAPQLLYFLVLNSVLPQAAHIAQAVRAMRPQTDTWAHGHCPVCGSTALMGEFAKGKASRNPNNEINKGGQLIQACSFCGTHYAAQRLLCPYCLEADAAKLDFFSVPEFPHMQVQTCQSCHGYIKIADFRQQIEGLFVPDIDDLASLPLDLAAQRKQLQRLTPTCWGL